MRRKPLNKANSSSESGTPFAEIGKILASEIDFLYRVCYRILLNREDVEDAVAETLYRAVSKFPTFKGESQLETWLYRIATNVCLDILRRRKTSLTFWGESNPQADKDSRSAEEVALSRLIFEERNRALITLLTRLKPRYRLVLVLREMEGLSYEEIASRFSCALGTVKSMLNRAKKEALKIIQEDEELKSILMRQKGEI